MLRIIGYFMFATPLMLMIIGFGIYNFKATVMASITIIALIIWVSIAAYLIDKN